MITRKVGHPIPGKDLAIIIDHPTAILMITALRDHYDANGGEVESWNTGTIADDIFTALVDSRHHYATKASTS